MVVYNESLFFYYFWPTLCTIISGNKEVSENAPVKFMKWRGVYEILHGISVQIIFEGILIFSHFSFNSLQTWIWSNLFNNRHLLSMLKKPHFQSCFSFSLTLCSSFWPLQGFWLLDSARNCYSKATCNQKINKIRSKKHF